MRAYLSHLKRALSGKTNFANDNAFDPIWQNRIKSLYCLVTIRGQIADFGCGKMWLKDMIDSGRHKYIPLDYIKRSADTVLYDANKEDVPRISPEVVFCSGFIEYLNNPKQFVTQISDINSVREVVVSYVPVELIRNQRSRVTLGWKNHLTLAEFISVWLRWYCLTGIELVDGNYLMRFSKIN